jgi:ribosomal protein S12 methylthiotransferase
VDSEALLGRFLAAGIAVADDPDAADIWILNTCGFIGAARADSLAAVEEMVAAKSADRTLAVVGCWAQEQGEELRRRFPAIDVVAGVGQFDEIVSACRDVAGPQVLQAAPEHARYPGLARRHLLTPPHVAFVKISEGCNCSCSFCRIPLIRGPHRSRSVVDIADEVQYLAGQGVQEIQLVSQNTSDFGRERGEDLLTLVKQLSRIEDLRWIRILYLYAGLIRPDTLLRLLELPIVLPYFDLPVQHASPRLLRAMKRPGDAMANEDFYLGLRRERPDLVLRSTVMLGFPGEQEEDVQLLADFLARVEFDHLGTYRYSPEVGTVAASLPDRVPQEVVADREAVISDLQADISLHRQTQRLGETHDLLVDQIVTADQVGDLVASLTDGRWLEKSERNLLAAVSRDESPLAIGRSYHFGYDLDGVVVLPGQDLRPGQWLDVQFRGVTAFDTWAVAS